MNVIYYYDEFKDSLIRRCYNPFNPIGPNPIELKFYTGRDLLLMLVGIVRGGGYEYGEIYDFTRDGIVYTLEAKPTRKQPGNGTLSYKRPFSDYIEYPAYDRVEEIDAEKFWEYFEEFVTNELPSPRSDLEYFTFSFLFLFEIARRMGMRGSNPYQDELDDVPIAYLIYALCDEGINGSVIEIDQFRGLEIVREACRGRAKKRRRIADRAIAKCQVQARRLGWEAKEFFL